MAVERSGFVMLSGMGRAGHHAHTRHAPRRSLSPSSCEHSLVSRFVSYLLSFVHLLSCFCLASVLCLSRLVCVFPLSVRPCVCVCACLCLSERLSVLVSACVFL